MATLLKFERGHMPEAPYPGLRPFEPHEWSIFFGREVMTAAVIEQLGSQNLIIVHGASGCGKSSLVRAGVLPALQVDHELNGSRFQQAIIRPSQGPLEALAAAFEANLGPVDEADPAKTWLNRIVVDDDLLTTINARLQRLDSSFCLIVDQFEEIFRWLEEEDPSQAESLVELLVAVAHNQAAGSRFFVLATMRSDYLGQCARFPGFAKVVNDCQYLLDNLDDFGILRAIHEPARRFGGRVEPDLADRLRAAAQSDPDPLPILQHSLMRIYDAVGPTDAGWRMTVDQLTEVSDDRGALSAHAEEIYKEVVGDDPNRREAAEWVFRALIDRDPGGRAIRRPTPFEELVAVSGADEHVVGEIVDAFSRSGRNLLVASKPEHSGRVRVDVSHEALIRRWGRIGDESIDAETGMPAGWLLREVESGLTWKALAVFARKGEKCLTVETTRQWRPLFDAVEKRPAWAKRYFVDPLPGLEPEQQPEWIAVMKLIEASRYNLRLESTRARRILRRYWLLLLVTFVLFMLAIAGFYWQQSEKAKVAAAASVAEARRAHVATTEARRVQTELATDRDRLREQGQAQATERTQLQAHLDSRERELGELLARSRREQEAARLQLSTAKTEAAAIYATLREERQKAVEEVARLEKESVKKISDLQATQVTAIPLPPRFSEGTQALFREVASPEGRELAQRVAIQVERRRVGYELTDDRRLALFAAFLSIHSRGFASLRDRLDLDARQIADEYPFHFRSAADAARFAHKPALLAAYLSEFDARTPPDEATTRELLRYAGRGLVRIRGRSAYEQTQKLLEETSSGIDIDIVENPEELEDLESAVFAAFEVWKDAGMNEFADDFAGEAAAKFLMSGTDTVRASSIVLDLLARGRKKIAPLLATNVTPPRDSPFEPEISGAGIDGPASAPSDQREPSVPLRAADDATAPRLPEE